ncbi:hypothetical protein THASP1DRAFT_27412 [Thamnocephalis sphaerospora]|uniref:STB6-like N-terminal domain-containing protein n=1 Tax=Thamnocephalis sphaerospora TaxID=78915 RepID=A0A4P9XWV4_9FUNG|nr:hypothetical protein THASP1DRAFT_27412 [Thamnocephalis sphaerospora]|eukprot:RKP10816.1 hypothetical protein THASP1DRAFT_27412 [Thamnocephalis sphaerospora]
MSGVGSSGSGLPPYMPLQSSVSAPTTTGIANASLAKAGKEVRFVMAEQARFALRCAVQPEAFSWQAADVTLTGYQAYVVEQWILDRQRKYASVAVFTGDAQHHIKACTGYAQRREDYEQLSIMPDERETLRIMEAS